MRILCVLRSGGDYRPEHVLRLQRQLAQHGQTDFACLSDVFLEGVETIPLRWDWPGWWAKMELFRPDLEGDFLFLDLDMTICGSLDVFADLDVLAMMRDVYRPGGLQSSIMYLPQSERPKIWQAWIRSPEHWQRRYPGGGDQAFLERFWLRKAKRLQDLAPGAIVSYKADVAGRGVPRNARIVCYHGRPRPWEVEIQ